MNTRAAAVIPTDDEAWGGTDLMPLSAFDEHALQCPICSGGYLCDVGNRLIEELL